MKAGTPKPADDLRMSGAEFDRIMGQILRVKPEPKKRTAKKKTPRKKASAGK